MRSEPVLPGWLLDLLGLDRPPREGEIVTARGRTLALRAGVLRGEGVASATQTHTSDVFGFKWQQRATFEGAASLARMREWLLERYGDPSGAQWLDGSPGPPVVLDAGCGAGMSALELFAPVFERIRYIGTDISDAVDVARARFAERGIEAGFLQADLHSLPFAPGSIDVIFSEGVLHHTDSTRAAIEAIVPLLKPRGWLLFYVYRRKGPIREFTDDLLRARVQDMAPQEAWAALRPITQLGKALGELGVELDVPEAVDLLGIPAGPIDLQRFFYWHVLKAFYRPELTLEEMHHINFDWYAPVNAHRQSPEEVRRWCADAGLDIARERIEDAGITIVARRMGDGSASR